MDQLREELQAKGFELSKPDYKEEAIRKLPGIKLDYFGQSQMTELSLRIKTELSMEQVEELIYNDLGYWFDGDDGSRIIDIHPIGGGFYISILLG